MFVFIFFERTFETNTPGAVNWIGKPKVRLFAFWLINREFTVLYLKCHKKTSQGVGLFGIEGMSTFSDYVHSLNVMSKCRHQQIRAWYMLQLNVVKQKAIIIHPSIYSYIHTHTRARARHCSYRIFFTPDDLCWCPDVPYFFNK